MSKEKFKRPPDLSEDVPGGQKMPERPAREEEDEDIEKTIVESIEGMSPMKEGEGLRTGGKREISEKKGVDIGEDEIDALARQFIEAKRRSEKQDVTGSEEWKFMRGLSPADMSRVARRALELEEGETKEAETKGGKQEETKRSGEISDEEIGASVEAVHGTGEGRREAIRETMGEEDIEGIEALKERFGKPMEERKGETEIEWKTPEAEKAETEEVEAVSATIVAGVFEEAGLEIEPSGLKGLMRGFGRRLRGVRKVFGQHLPEILIGGVIGTGAKLAFKSALGLAGLGAFATAPAAGGVAGAASGGIREYLKTKGEQRMFIKEVQGEEEELTLERMAEKREELKSKLKEEKDPKRQEVLSDQFRYLLMEIERRAKREKPSLERIVHDIIEASSKIDKEAWPTEQRRLLKEINKAKGEKNRRMLRAIGKGALSGAFGGLMGGWFIDNFGVIRDLFGHLPGAEYLTSRLSPGSLGGEVFPPTEVIKGITKEAAKESLGLDTAMLPSIINLEAGSNPWATMAELLPDFNNTELQEVVQEVCKASDVGVKEWNLPGRTIDRLLPIGFELQITPDVKEIVQTIIDKRG